MTKPERKEPPLNNKLLPKVERDLNQAIANLMGARTEVEAPRDRIVMHFAIRVIDLATSILEGSEK